MPLHIRLELGEPAEGELDGVPKAVAEGEPLAVVELFGNADELVAHLANALEVRTPACENHRVRPERLDERALVFDPPGNPDGLLRQGKAPLVVLLREVELVRERGEEGRPERAIVRGESGEGLFQKGHHALVHRPHLGDAEAPPVAEGGPGEELRGPDGARPIRRRGEGLVGFLPLAPPEPRFPEGEPHLAERLWVGPLAELEGLEGASVVLRGLLVGDQVYRTLTGSHRVIDGLRHVAADGRLEEVMRELAQVGLGAGSVEPLERLSDLAV